MAKPTQQGDTAESTQTNLNRSMDAEFDVLGVEMLGYDSIAAALRRVLVAPSGALVTSPPLTSITSITRDENNRISQVVYSDGSATNTVDITHEDNGNISDVNIS